MAEEKFNYESAIAELETIVAKLTAGNVSLDESLVLYTRGVELAKLCQQRLTEIEQKISIVNNDGSITSTSDNSEEE